MKANDIPEYAIAKTHCDWIMEQAMELKSLLSYNSDTMINYNKVRAFSAINNAINSLNELKAYIEEHTK